MAVLALPANGPLKEPLTVPVNVGLASGAFSSNNDCWEFSAVCWAVETGLSASLVSLTLASPTIAAVMPPTVPVKVGEASGAFKSSAVCCAVETGLSASLVLFALPSPTMVAVIPPTVPVNLGEASGAMSLSLPSSLLIAERIVSVAARVPAPAT